MVWPHLRIRGTRFESSKAFVQAEQVGQILKKFVDFGFVRAGEAGGSKAILGSSWSKADMIAQPESRSQVLEFFYFAEKRLNLSVVARRIYFLPYFPCLGFRVIYLVYESATTELLRSV